MLMRFYYKVGLGELPFNFFSETEIVVKAMDDIGVAMTPFGGVVTVILVVNSYVK